jgi:hypothetical protein
VVVTNEMPLYDGMTGRCRRGPLAGFLVNLEKYADDAWLLYWANPDVPVGTGVIGRDVGDRLLPTSADARVILREDLDVEWFNAQHSEEIRRVYFDMPEPLPRNPFFTLRQFLRRVR